MAYRKIIIATNETYHIYNRGVEKRPIFLRRGDYSRFIDLINYYRFVDCPLKYSHFKELSHEVKTSIMERLENGSKRYVDIFSFCLMPNHMHFLLRQLIENGISKFMSKIQNGFSHYFNIHYERVGHLFQGNFGAKRIENEEQLIHVNRYIHLNPVMSYLIKLEDLDKYQYSSYPDYIDENNSFCNTKDILSYFSNVEKYKKFIYNQVDYAKKLKEIEHLLLE